MLPLCFLSASTLHAVCIQSATSSAAPTDRPPDRDIDKGSERERERQIDREREREGEWGTLSARKRAGELERDREGERGTERERVRCGLQRKVRFRAPSPPPAPPAPSKGLRLCFERTGAKATVWWALYRDTAFYRVFSLDVWVISWDVWKWHAKCCCV